MMKHLTVFDLICVETLLEQKVKKARESLEGDSASKEFWLEEFWLGVLSEYEGRLERVRKERAHQEELKARRGRRLARKAGAR